MRKSMFLATSIMVFTIFLLAFFGGCSIPSNMVAKDLPKTGELLERVNNLKQNEIVYLSENLRCHDDKHGIVDFDGAASRGITGITHYVYFDKTPCKVTCKESYLVDLECAGGILLNKNGINAIAKYCEDANSKILSDKNLFALQPECHERDEKKKKEEEQKRKDLEKLFDPYSSPILPKTSYLLWSLSQSDDMNNKITIMEQGYGLNYLSEGFYQICFITTFNQEKIEVCCKDTFLEESAVSTDKCDKDWCMENFILGKSDREKMREYCENTSAKILADPEIFPQ